MNLFDAVKLQLALKRRAALKDLIPGTDPARAIGIADTCTMRAMSLDVYGMIFTGIDIIVAIQDAMTLTHSTHVLHETEMLLKMAPAVTLPGAASTSVMSAERFLFAGNFVGVLGAYVGVWISLGGAWAQAKADILTGQAMLGVSRGTVLGANDAAPSYVSQNFWLDAQPACPAYREVEKAAKNMHNIALVAGYAQGKSLSRNQKGNLFRFIHTRLTPGSQSYYSGEWKNWGSAKKKSYYTDCAACFRRDFLRSDSN